MSMCRDSVPRHFFVCVFGYGFCFHPTIPGWGVGACAFVCVLCPYPAKPDWGLRCVCSVAGFGFTPPILAGVCGACVSVRVLLSPHQSWLGCWGVRALPVPRQSWLGSAVRVFECGFWLHPANPGWGLWCVCLGLGFAFTPPILAGVLGCVCLCARSACTPPILAGVCGLGVCAWVRVLAAPRQSWLGCAYPANPGWGLWCVCLGTGFAFTPSVFDSGPLHFEVLNMFITLYRNMVGSTPGWWLGLFGGWLGTNGGQKVFGNPLFLWKVPSKIRCGPSPEPHGHSLPTQSPCLNSSWGGGGVDQDELA